MSIYRLHLYPKIQRSTCFNIENRKGNATHSQNIRAEKRYVQENEKRYTQSLVKTKTVFRFSAHMGIY